MASGEVDEQLDRAFTALADPVNKRLRRSPMGHAISGTRRLAITNSNSPTSNWSAPRSRKQAVRSERAWSRVRFIAPMD